MPRPNGPTPLALALLLTAPLAACGGGEAETPESEETSGGEGMTSPEGTDALAAVIETQDDWLEAVLAMPHRSEENRARDRYRHPVETLTFFGLEPDATVVELSPGGGWYTEILAPALSQGTLVTAIPDPEGDPEYYGTRLARQHLEMVEGNPAVFGNVEPRVWTFPDRTSLGEPGSADMVVTFRSFHGWVRRGQAADVIAAAYEVLEPGGVFAVVQHRAPEGADAAEWAEKGYVPEATIVELAEAAGFRIDARSEINANPDDTKDHPEGVWTLPPTLRLGDQDRARYEAIGESDRMTLRFVKPGA